MTGDGCVCVCVCVCLLVAIRRKEAGGKKVLVWGEERNLSKKKHYTATFLAGVVVRKKLSLGGLRLVDD